jgi:hypothetical protein
LRSDLFGVADSEFMPDAIVIEWIRTKYIAIITDLDERGRRRWAAVEATSLGWGGISAVAQATGISDRTIQTGIRELEDPEPLSSTRQRKPGADVAGAKRNSLNYLSL